MTTSRYYTPNGVCIHGIGIVPDIQIAADGTMIEDGVTDESTYTGSAESESSSGEALAADSSESKDSSLDSIDYQLNAAIDAVKAQLK